MRREIEAVVQSIVLRSATLQERIAWHLEGEEFQETAASRDRLSQWKKQFQALGEDAFANHIAMLGLSASDLLPVLGSPLPRRDRPVPAWAELLGSILAGLSDPSGCKETAGLFAHRLRDMPTAFLELYWPVVRCAREHLRQTTSAVCAELSGEAQIALEAHLLERLLQAGRQIIQLQFAVFQTVAQSGFRGGDAGGTEEVTALQRNFVGPAPSKRLHQLFDEYPVHARHCAVLAFNWINASRRFLARLAQDRARLNEQFNQGHCLGTITGLQVGLSDPHHGGETVLAVTFSNGCEIVYKPRSLLAEQLFSELLSRIGDPKSFRRFQAPRIWDRGDYGWMELVDSLPCHNLAGVKRFYWRAGGLLGLLHLARGVDCHRGNLIAQGEHPVLIDVDTLWHPQNLPQPVSTIRSNISRPSRIDSVLRTGCLPGGSISESHSYSASALEIDSDGQFGAADAKVRGCAHLQFSHLPRVAQSLVGASAYTAEILAGFRWVGRTILLDAEWQSWFLQWLDRIKELPRRHIHRSTVIYATKLRDSCQPQKQKAGIDFSLALKLPLAAPAEAAIEMKEISSLEQLDIPYLFQRLPRPPTDTAESLPPAASYFSELEVIKEALQQR